MAYFQIAKNSKEKFFALKKKEDRTKLAAEDYEKASESLVKNACEYRLFVLSACNGDLNQALPFWFPFLSNCGLVCELFLKSILCFEQTDYMTQLGGKDRHSLNKLYGLLKSDTKEEILVQFPYTNERNQRRSKREYFDLCLREDAQAFFEYRYSTEYTGLAGEVYFLPDFIKALYAVAKAKNIIKNS